VLTTAISYTLKAFSNRKVITNALTTISMLNALKSKSSDRSTQDVPFEDDVN